MNRLIHGTGSLSGREANVFYLNLGNGKFADVSGTSGLDFSSDGRAFSRLDIDQDGDLDIILKSRTGPQVRILRNNNANGNNSAGLRLIGTQSNRDAIGAIILLRSSSGQRTKQRSLGSGFLSQSTEWVYFGLGTAETIDEVEIHWPSGTTSLLQTLPVNHRITIVEGEEGFQAEPFHKRPALDEECPAPEAVSPAPAYGGIAMGEPVVLPPYEVEDLEGRTVPLARKGMITIVNLWATWCAPCQVEMELWKEHYRAIREAGAELMAVSVDDPDDYDKVRAFVDQRALAFPVSRMAPETLERFVIFYKILFTRSGDPPIPTTLLLNKKGEVAKVYVGVIPAEALLEDIQDLRQGGDKLKQAFLPYPGRTLETQFSRDYHTLAVKFIERNMLSEASLYLNQAIKTDQNNARLWNKLGLVYADTGELAESRNALERAVQLDPGFANGQFDLGVTYLRLNSPAEAEAALALAVKLDPADPKKRMMYELTLAQNGGRNLRGGKGDPISVLEHYLKEVPTDVEAQFNLGALYSQRGDHTLALEQFKKAYDLDPYSANVARNLGVEYLKQQRPFDALPVLQRYLSLRPNDPEVRFALAIVYGQMGRQNDAVQQLERVLELQPGHPQASQILQQIRPRQ